MSWWCKCVPIEECRYISTPDCTNNEVSIYSITVAGLTNDDCDSCNDWNGTFDLEYMEPGIWESPPSGSGSCNHSPGDPLWRLDTYYVGFYKYYRLSAVGLGYAWRLYEGDWFCGHDNTLTKVPAVIMPNPCLGVPNTISLVPCLRVCPHCIEDTDTGTSTATGDVLPDTISVTLTASTDPWASCSWCSSFSGTYLLERIRDCQWVYQGTAECEGCPINFSISAIVDDGGYGIPDVAWNCTVVIWTPVGRCVGIPTDGPVGQSVRYHWRSGGIHPIDCTMTRDLTFRDSYATYVYWPEYGGTFQSEICIVNSMRVN